MPFPKRVIQPVHVTRGTLPDDFPLPSELEAVTNGTLANTVRQLSSLSRHAEDLFGELVRDAHTLYDRSNALQARIDRLAVKVTSLDSTVEEVSLQDIHMRKAFKSAMVFDQQMFTKSTMPTAMKETYETCDKPPPLDKLNCYRDDGKDGLKFYTDPNYFFELWRQEMLSDTQRMMHDRGKKQQHRPRPDGGQGQRHKKRVRQPHNTRERQRQIAMGHGEYIMPQQGNQSGIYRTPNVQQQLEVEQEPRPPRPNSIEVRRSYPQEVPDGLGSPTYPRYDENPYQHGMYGQGPLSSESLYAPGSGPGTPTRTKSRPSQPPPAPPSASQSPSSSTPTRARAMSTNRDNLPPPPPPPEATMSPPNGLPPHLQRQHSHSRSNSPLSSQLATPDTTQDLPPPPPIPKQASPPKEVIPPPPPPPPMPAALTNGNNTANTMANNMAMLNGDLAKILNQTPPKLTPVKDRPPNPKLPAIVDTRNDLLKAIRDGIKLRKVEKIEQKEVERGNGLHDVASILARRVAVEFSDSESGSESEDSEGWGDNETSA